MLAAAGAPGGRADAEEFDHTHAAYTAVLKARVVKGAVDYAALKAGRTALDGYLDALAAVPSQTFRTWSEAQRLAFLFNLYNASTLRLIIDHYPVESIRKIGTMLKGPWAQPVVRLFGKTTTLDKLEHEVLRREYNEPRLHLALVCAARGCPPLRRDAYRADGLDAQLKQQSQSYLASPVGMRIDRERSRVYLSAIFKWYGKDFVKAYAGRIRAGNFGASGEASLGFALEHVTPADREYIKRGNYKLRHLDYDWSLNAQ
ncbi:MAG: DUF547 domain-containing protein [Verrucomicrobia bacterium]|nr:DUF547 domain-containing protein [Verrucomicrobiota bacterium]MBT7067945.1 DUF547 domain-containing protein [Verrucomicrobiota bacterium]MBT7700586.1 DUF547 domain-containing protein [Verrucomicrobiota bacterium]